MISLKEKIVGDCVRNTLGTMRNRPDLQWAPEDYWWPGIQLAWLNLSWPNCLPPHKPMSADEVSRALVERGVPESAIRACGKHTRAELGNITFIYFNKRFKDGRVELRISPHINGLKFKECGHAFHSPNVGAAVIACNMLAINESVPACRTACAAAYQDGLRERKIREIKAETARTFLKDLFGGNKPDGLTGFTIADSRPGAMDLIRLRLADGRRFDIPFEDRDMLPLEYVTDFISTKDTSVHSGALEIFVDEETGKRYPIARVYSY